MFWEVDFYSLKCSCVDLKLWSCLIIYKTDIKRVSRLSQGLNMAFIFCIYSYKAWKKCTLFNFCVVKMTTFRAHTNEISYAITTQRKTIWLSLSKSSEIIFTLWTSVQILDPGGLTPHLKRQQTIIRRSSSSLNHKKVQAHKKPSCYSLSCVFSGWTAATAAVTYINSGSAFSAKNSIVFVSELHI